MKKLKSIGWTVCLLWLATSGCGKKGILVNFDSDYSFKFRVPANTILSLPLNPLSFEEETNTEAQYAANDTRKDLLESVALSSLWLEIESPATEDFDFLKSVEIYVNSSGLAEALVAEKNPVPDNLGKMLTMDLKNVELAPYLKADAFQVRTRAVTDESRSQDITIKGEAKFLMRARVIGSD